MFKSSKLDSLSFIILQIVLFLAPLFFVPTVAVPLGAGKAALIIYGILAAFICWAIARLRDGVFEAPKSLFYASAGILAIVYGLSAVLSGNTLASLSGQAFELGTAAFFIPSLLLFLLVPLVVKRTEQAFFSYMTLLVSFFCVVLFHLIKLCFGPDALSFGGLLSGATANLIGKWNDVGIFCGLAAIISFITLERASLGKLVKVLTVAAFVLSLVMLMVVNFSTAWKALLVFSLVFVVYELSLGKKERVPEGRSRVPVWAIVALAVSILFTFAGNSIGGSLNNKLGISQVEVRPSWSATAIVSKAALSEDPLFGIGPNRFANIWTAHKPDGINSTIFWNTDFNYGIGFLSSFLVTNGIIGFLATLLFVGLFIWVAFRALVKTGSSAFSRYLVLSSLLGSAYLWVFSIIYVPAASIWIITLFLTGLLLVALREDKALGMVSLNTADKAAPNFISVLVLVFALISAVWFGWSVTVKLAANIDFQRAVIAANAKGDLDAAETLATRALTLAPSDSYTQFLSSVYLARINVLLGRTDVSQADAQKMFQDYLSKSIQAANAGIAIDPTDYVNYTTLGRVFEAVVPLNIQGAYENAKQAFEKSLALNPSNPETYLFLARLESAKKDNKAALEYIAKALQQKNDYAEAIFLLSQIQTQEGDLVSATKSVEAVATLSPSDSGIFFQLGLLYYNQQRYSDAVLAFQRAIALNAEYANAKYFLGLSLYYTNDKAGAMVQFKDVEKTNADNADLKAIIKNLEAGKAPFTKASTKPEKAAKLPVKETTVSDDN